MSKKLLVTASVFSHIQAFHLPYLRQFRELGFEVHVACGGKTTELYEADMLIELPLEKRILSYRNFRASRILRRLIRENSYSLIITHTTLAAFYTRLALKGLRKRPRCINVVHGYLFGDGCGRIKSMLFQAAELWLRNETDKLLTMNTWDYDWAVKHRAAAAVHRIPGMGADIKRAAERTDTEENGNRFTLVYLAEFSKRKNQKFLIKALTQLPENIRLILAGDGEFRRECIALADKYAVDERVDFPGYVSDIRSLLERADAAVSSSLSEGLPFNILEAMLSSLPVIASDVKGHRELVKDGVNGCLYDVKDCSAFADAVVKLISDREKARSMGKAGAEMAQSYTLESVMKSVMMEYLT